MSMIDDLEIWCIQQTYRDSEKKREPTTLQWKLKFVLTVVLALWWSGAAGARPFRADSDFGDPISDGQEFDSIVVGAGAAGSAAAARLALAGLRVLLLEAGGEPGLLSKMPAAALSSIGTNIDWSYSTLSNNVSCLAEKTKSCHFARGKCLGGSTSINKMMYTRGNREDFDFNLPGWSYEDMKPYFLRFEGFKDSQYLPKSSENYYNSSGIVPIEYFAKSANPWPARFFEGLQYLNIPKNRDVNGASQIGVTRVPGYTTGGERVSTAKAYLDHDNVKQSLTLAKNILCTGVIIDENNVARGIRVSRGAGETLQLYSKQEIILSAGTIGTAQLLMLSGVGPKEHLSELSIPLKADLPVGEDMSDHILASTLIKVDHNHSKASTTLSLAKKLIQGVQWLSNRSGELASIGLDDVTLFINSNCYDFVQKKLNNDRSECEIPSLQYIFSYMEKGVLNLMSSILDRLISPVPAIRKQMFDANEESSLLFVAPVVLRPHSRGWIRLASADPFVPPLIMPNYLHDERDVEEMVRGLKLVENLVETPIFKEHNASILRYEFDGCEGQDDEYWRCHARQMTYSVHHAVGTAALGRVLDTKMRVRGVKNLRVADASALPLLPRGNTAASMIALGERVSDLVLQDLGIETYISTYLRNTFNN